MNISMEAIMSGNKTDLFSPLTIFYFASCGTLYLLLVITNGFIVGVNLADWRKGRSMMPSDEILAALGVSNISFSTAIILDYFLSFLWNDYYSTCRKVQKMMTVIDIATSILSFWFTAWLSVFYCVKIVNFKQPFLFKVKQNFSVFLHWLLLGSVLVSFGVALFGLQDFHKVRLGNPAKDLNDQTVSLASNSNLTSNGTEQKKFIFHMTLTYKLHIMILGCVLPLMLTIFSSILVLKSLCTHVWNLEQNTSVFYTPCLEAHVSAAKAVLSLILSYSCLYVAEILVRNEVFFNWTFQYFLCLTVQLSALVAQGFILILSNPKLKSSAAHILTFVQQ